MSLDLPIRLGIEVPIRYSSFNGTTTMTVEATIRDNDNVVVSTIDLVHSNNGRYAPAVDFVMVEKTFIEVHYIPYTTAAKTTEDPNHARDLDIFILDDSLSDAEILSAVSRSQAISLEVVQDDVVFIEVLCNV